MINTKLFDLNQSSFKPNRLQVSYTNLVINDLKSKFMLLTVDFS